MKNENKAIREIQNKIGYEFKNTDLLFQAFIRKSYSEENGGENNEVLEFIGDKVLDIVVVKLLSEKYGKIEKARIADCNELDAFVSSRNEGQLSDMKRQLVEKKKLADRMSELGLSDYLIMSKGDLEKDVQYSQSAMEDLFEAIIGAVALDSNWNLDKLQNVIENMLDFESFESDEDLNYNELLQNWSLKKHKTLPDVSFPPLDRYENPQSPFLSRRDICAKWTDKKTDAYGMEYIDIAEVKKCVIRLTGIDYTFIGYGYSNKNARKAASKVAYEYLEKNNLLFSIYDEIDEKHINEFEAINQLETLSRRGYFQIPYYSFEQSFDGNGNPVWICTCSVEGYDKQFSSESSSKKDAKKTAAFEMLKFILQKPQNNRIIGGFENEKEHNGFY